LRRARGIGLRQRLADDGPVHRGWSDVAEVRDRGSFGHAVSLINDDAGEFGKATREFGRERGGSGLYPGNVVVGRELSGFGGLVERVQSGWDDRHHGDALGSEQAKKLWDVETRHQD
jgi:hypothetical protein